MRLLFVSDGERDAQTVPCLVERILETPIKFEVRPWARLQGRGRGYKKKLQYALHQARGLPVCGVVATVDRDRDEPLRRLNELKKGLGEDREKNQPVPTALGEAVPHGEAWLLDDSVAVRQALDLPSEVKIPAVRKVDPKTVINGLISESSLAADHMRALSEIARAVEVSRSPNAKKTGLAAFAKEVKSELGPLTAESPTSSGSS